MIPKKEEQDSHAGLLKAIANTLNQFRLYSTAHPLAKEALQRLSEEMEKFFLRQNKINLGVMKDLLVIDGKVTGEKDLAAKDLSKSFQRVGIESVAFEKGIGMPEMTQFLSLVGMRGRDLEGKGGFRKVFEDHRFSHVKLAHGQFKLVEEGQAVGSHPLESLASQAFQVASELSQAQAERTPAPSPTEPPPVLSMREIIQRIRSGQKDPLSVKDSEPVLDCEKVVEDLETHPAEIARSAVSQVKNTTELEGVVRHLTQYLVKGLISFLVEHGKDLTKALDRLAKELEKAVEKSLGAEEANKMKIRIPKIFQETIDELRLQMMVKVHQDHPEDSKAVQKMAGKLFKDEEVRKRLAPALKDELQEAGFQPKNLEAVFQEMEAKAAKKKQKISVDAEEMAELKRKAELYDRYGGGGGGGGEKEEVVRLKKENKKLSDEKERVEKVIHNLGEGLLVVDKEGKVVLMNPAAEKLLGVKQSDQLGKKVADSMKQEHLLALTKGNLREVSEGETAKSVELVSLDERTKKVLQASTAIIENEDGKTVGMVSVLSDVTKQKEIEELKNQFVSHVSHELRTPMIAIQKSLGLMLDKTLGEINPEQQKFLDIAHRNIDRLSRLVNDLLDVSKLEEGKMVLRPEPVVLKEAVGHVLNTLGTWLKNKNIQTEIQIPEDGVSLEADPDRLTQVMTNLMGNALKYTPDGGKITVDIQTNVKDDAIPGECIEIGVRDTGIGISPEDQKKIFEKFVQVGDAQPKGVASTGLGLTIAKEIVELHSGRIYLESEVGKGSRFYFRLPKKFTPKG